MLRAAGTTGGLAAVAALATGDAGADPATAETQSGADDGPPQLHLLQVASRCATDEDADAVTAEFDAAWNLVAVRGTVLAADPCRVAEASVRETADDSEGYEAVVTTAEPADAEICAQCVGAVHYLLALVFESGLPDREGLRIVHESPDGRVVVFPTETESSTT
jgi:hypothetical protein